MIYVKHLREKIRNMQMLNEQNFKNTMEGVLDKILIKEKMYPVYGKRHLIL